MNTLEHHRAEAAIRWWDAVPPEKQAVAADLVPGFGAEVQRCGLLQAVAFLRRDAGAGDTALVDALTDAIRDHLVRVNVLTLAPADRERPLLGIVRELDADRYMLATREVLAFSPWLKRAAR